MAPGAEPPGVMTCQMKTSLLRLVFMGRFIGRVAELSSLEQAYQGRQAAFIPIWGRRRVGKSTLIRQFAKGKPCLYFLGKETRSEAQLKEFLEAAAMASGESVLAELAPDDWKRVLLRTVEMWKTPRLILVLDEFQYLAAAVEGLTSILQECWDLHWKDGGKVMLILCGSQVGFMEREVLGRKSPLFGRRTAQLRLRSFGHVESADFLPKWSLEQKACAHFLCGGVPMYLERFDEDSSLRSNIERLFLSPTGIMAYEVDFLLREELREVQNYYAVLSSIAGGDHSTKTIARTSGIPEGSLKYYLRQLTELGYVARQFPLFDKPPKRNQIRYILDDALLRFWFRFVADRTSIVHHYGPKRSFDKVIAPQLESYWGLCFERLCRAAMPLLYEAEDVGAGFQVGEYWDRHVQVDLVGFRDDDWTDLGECKWSRVRSVAAVDRELMTKVAKYPNSRNATIGRRLFLRKRPRAASENLKIHDLEDLFQSGAA